MNMLRKVVNSIVNPSYAMLTNIQLGVGIVGLVVILWILL